MTALIPFAFDSHAVRTLMIDDQPWFVGKDVALALGYTNPNKAIGDHCKGVTKRYPLQTIGGIQELRIIPESDVFRLIVSSHLPEAEQFERWVFEEVLPSLRRHGHYGTVQATDTPASLMAALRTETNPAVQIMVYQQLEKCCRQQRLRLPEMGDLVPGGELIAARLFARAIVTIQRARYAINHSRKPGVRAYNYSRIHKLAKELGCPLPPKRELIPSLRQSGYFVGERLVDSKLRRQQVLCWVFRRRV